MQKYIKQNHYEETILVPASTNEVFAFVDDHSRFSSHMNNSSWMMVGSKMKTEIDEGQGKKIGSHIKMSGKILGLDLFLDEVVTFREPPTRKEWETVGVPQLVVIGNYKMGIVLDESKEGTKLTVFIDYDLPHSFAGKLFGILLGGMYAKWCVKQMIGGVKNEYE